MLFAARCRVRQSVKELPRATGRPWSFGASSACSVWGDGRPTSSVVFGGRTEPGRPRPEPHDVGGDSRGARADGPATAVIPGHRSSAHGGQVDGRQGDARRGAPRELPYPRARRGRHRCRGPRARGTRRVLVRAGGEPLPGDRGLRLGRAGTRGVRRDQGRNLAVDRAARRLRRGCATDPARQSRARRRPRAP